MNKMILLPSILAVLAMYGCEQTPTPVEPEPLNISPEQLQGFIQAIKANLVFVDGGDFLMGDFGPQYGAERLPFDREPHSKPLHQVALTAYSMGKFKVTNAEFQFYLKYNGMMLRKDGTAYKKNGMI